MASFLDWVTQYTQGLDAGEPQAPPASSPIPFTANAPSAPTQSINTDYDWAAIRQAQQALEAVAQTFTSDPAATAAPIPFSSVGSQTRMDELPPSAPTVAPPPAQDLLQPTGNPALDIAINQNPLLGPLNTILKTAPYVYDQARNTPVLGDVIKKGEEALQGYTEHIQQPFEGLAAIGLQSAVAQIPGGERPDIFSQGGTTKEELMNLLTRQDTLDTVGETFARLGEIGRTKTQAFDQEAGPLGSLAAGMVFDPLNFIPGAGIGEAQKFRQAAGAITDVTKVDDALKTAPFLSKVFDFFSPLVRAKEGELVGLGKLGLEQESSLAKRVINPLTAFQNTPRAKAINYVQKVHDWLLPQAAAEGLTREGLAQLLDTASNAARKGEFTPELQKIISDRGITNSADFQRTVNGALGWTRPAELDQTYVRAHELRAGIEEWTQGARPSIENLRATLLTSEPWADAFNDLGANYRGAYQRFAKTLDAYETGKRATGINEVRAAARQLNADIETIGKLELASEFVDHSARVAQQFSNLSTEANLSQQIMNKIKAYESVLLLAPNPHYVAQNIISDWVRLAMFGVNPMEATEDLGKLFNRAYGTSDFKSVLGDVADILKQADVSYAPNAAFGGNLPAKIRKLPGIKQLNDFNQAMNDRNKVRAFATGFRRAYQSAWKYGQDIPELPEQLANVIRQQGGERALKSVIKKLEQSFNANEMRDAITTPFPMWQAYSDAVSPALDAVFAKHGLDFKTTPDMLEHLISHGTGDFVNEIMSRTFRRAQTEGVDFFGRIWDEEARKVQTAHADFKAGQAEWERQTFGRDFAAATPEEAAQRAKEAADKARVPGATDVPPQGVPPLITREMERRLKVLGYDQAVIDGLNPQEAHDILRGGKKFTPTVIEPKPMEPPASPDLAAQLRSQEQGLLNRQPAPANVIDATRRSRFIRILNPEPIEATGVDDIRHYITENPALNVVDEGAWNHLLTFKNADGTPRYTPQELATWRPHKIEEVAIRDGYASSTYNDFLRVFEKKTGKDATKSGDYFKNLLNAEIKRKGYYDPDLADMKPFESWKDVRERPWDAYHLLRNYNEYPTLQEGEFKIQLRLKMIEDGIPDELQNGIEAIYDALGATAAKRAGVDVDTWWVRNMAGIEGAPNTSQLRGLKQEQGKWYYSQLQRTVENLKQEKFTAEQLRGMLKQGGVKADEMKWTGFDEWLDRHPKATKQEALDYLKTNQVEVKEVTRGNGLSEAEQNRLSQIGRKFGNDPRNLTAAETEEYVALTRKAGAAGLSGAPKYSSYVLPGGDNYRELLLTLPKKEVSQPYRAELEALQSRPYFSLTDAEKSRLQELKSKALDHYVERDAAANYRSPHFDEPNILAHVRFNDRTTADGGKMLFIEEVQSDWAQAGRDKGFKDALTGLPEQWKVVPSDTAPYKFMVQHDNGAQVAAYGNTEAEALQKALSVLNTGGVPPMPFANTYEELSLKRMIRYAAENGYDSIGWTTGAQQAERYNLAKQVDSVLISKTPEGGFTIDAMRNGSLILSDEVPSVEKLSEFVGKDLAKKADTELAADAEKEYSGVDLKVGGEGMKAAYDKRLVNKMNDLAKKFGGKVEKTDLGGVNMDAAPKFDPNTGKDIFPSLDIHSITITPQMREGAMQGFALFQGAAGATDFLPDGRRLMRFFKGEADASTYIHEAGHVFLPTLDASDMDEVARWTGLDSGTQLRELHMRWARQDPTLGNLPGGKRAPYQFRDMAAAKTDAERYVIAQEKFARGFEKYMAEGVAPTEGLQRVFDQFKDFLLDIYRNITGSDIDVKLTDEMRALYGRMLDADQVISPQELKQLQQQAVRQARGELAQGTTGVGAHLKAGFFDTFFQHGIPESKKIWQYTKATEGMPHWWYPIGGSGGARGNLGQVRGQFPPFVSALGPNKAQLFGTSKKDWKLVNGSDNPEWADFVLESYNQILYPDGERALETIDDLMALVEDNVAHNSPLRTLEQRGVKRVKGQADMFGAGSPLENTDLPLFSGTAQTAKESAFVPQEVAQQGTMFDMRPQFGGENVSRTATDTATEGIGRNDTQLYSSAPTGGIDTGTGVGDVAPRGEAAVGRADTPSGASVTGAPYDLAHPATDEAYWGKVIAEIVQDPRNITREEWRTLDPIYKHLNNHPEAASDWWDAAKSVAEAESVNVGKVTNYSAGSTASVRRASNQYDRVNLKPQTDLPSAGTDIGSVTTPNLSPNAQGQFSLFQDVANRLKDPTASTDPNLKADVETAMAEELLKILKPLIEADIQNYGRALDPVTNKLIEQFIHAAEPRMTEAKQVGGTMGRWYQQHTTMDYSQRWNVDDAMSLYAPFTFYPLHMAALLGQDFLDKPALFAMYTKLQKEADRQSEGLPARFAHRLKIPMPLLPDWMGDGMFFDPFATAFPVRQVFNLDDLERATFNSQNGEPMDNASLIQDMYSPHLPWKLGKALLMGDGAEVQDTIANLPPMRMAKAWGAPYDLSIAGVKPLQGKWDNFYLQRAARDLVADNTLSDKDMRIALLTHKGAAWDAIVERSRLQNYTAPVMSGWSGFTGKVYPAGELKYNETRMQRDQLKEELLAKHGASPHLDDQQAYEFLKAKGEYAEGGQMRAFLDAHPELDAAQAFNDTDQIYRDYLTDGIWEKLQNAGSLQNKLWRAQLGEDFDQLFAKGKRKADYAAVPIQKLLGWANALKINLPQVTPDLQATPDPYQVSFATPAQTQAYQAMQDEIKNTIGWDNYFALNQKYQALKTQDKARASAFLKTAEGKQLIAVWETQDDFYKNNPDVLKLLEQAGVLEKKASAQTQAAPGTEDAQKQAWGQALTAIGYQSYDEYTAERDAYFALPQGSQARRDYLATRPRLARMFAASRAIYGEDKTGSTGNATGTGSSYSNKPYNWQYRPRDTYFGKTYGKPKANPRLNVSYASIFRQMGGTQQRPQFQRYRYEPYDKFPRRIMPRQ